MDVEILVHISAPTTHRDDERYLAMAEAYADFEPHDPEDCGLLRAVEESPEIEAPEWNSQDTTALSRAPSSAITYNDPPTPTVEVSFASTNAETAISDDYYGSFPSVTSAKALDNTDKVNISFPLGSEENSSPPRSRLEQLEQIHARWRRAAPKSITVKGPEDVGNQDVKSPTDDAPLFIEDTQLAEQALETQVYDGFFTSYPSDSELSFPVADYVEGHANTEHATNLPEPIIVPTEEPYAPSPQYYSHPVQLTPSRFQADEDEWRLVEQQINSEQGQRRDPDAEIIESDADDEQFEVSSFPTEVFPPSPQISTKEPGSLPSQITRELEVVRQQNATRFQPLRKLRDLEADERGYWLIDVSSWPLKARTEFWSSLYEHVRQERFGWGVSLTREQQLGGERSSQC
jgi:hypothetical protein